LEVFTSFGLEIRPVWRRLYSHRYSFLAARKGSAERRRKSRSAVLERFPHVGERPVADDKYSVADASAAVNV
jgi:hypothetical protein